MNKCNASMILFIIQIMSKKMGKKLYDIEIISPDRLLSLNDDSEVVITSQYDIDMASQLLKMGIKNY